MSGKNIVYIDNVGEILDEAKKEYDDKELESVILIKRYKKDGYYIMQYPGHLSFGVALAMLEDCKLNLHLVQCGLIKAIE